MNDFVDRGVTVEYEKYWDPVTIWSSNFLSKKSSNTGKAISRFLLTTHFSIMLEKADSRVIFDMATKMVNERENHMRY